MLRRILTILGILASIGVVVVSHTKLKDHINQIRETRDTYEKQRNNETTRANKAESTLKTTSNTLVTTRGELASKTKELTETQGNLEQVTGARDRALQDLAKAQEAEKTARRDLEAWNVLGMKPQEVKAMQEELGKTTAAVKAMTEEALLLNRRIAKLTNQLNEFLIADYEIVMPHGLKGNILVVDPKWEFVVLDIGEKQGAVKNGIMMVHRDSKLVGKVRITNVMTDRSIANILPGWRLEEIREGDRVLF